MFSRGSNIKEPKSNMTAYMLGGAGVAGMGFLAMKAMALRSDQQAHML